MFRLIKLLIVAAVAAAGYLFISFGTVQPCDALRIAVVQDVPAIVDQASRAGPQYAVAAAALRALDPESAAARQLAEELAQRWTRDQNDVTCAFALGKRLFTPEAFRADVIRALAR